MIETLYGRVLEINYTASAAVIECAGVGYRVTVTSHTLSKLPAPVFEADGLKLAGDPVRIYTHLAVREDAVELFGFSGRDELDTFRTLIGVSGIGPRAAISILSVFTPSSLAQAVYAGDAKSISQAQGIGPKTAARVVLELKDKLNIYLSAPSGGRPDQKVQSAPLSGKMGDVQSALSALGYSKSEIASAMRFVDGDLEVEEIIKQALAVLVKNI